MPSKKRGSANPDALRNFVGVPVTDFELARIKRVAARYGLSMAGAVRLMMRTGAEQHDPFTPTEGDTTT